MRRTRGFTLAELMTVVAVMATIASIAVISVRKRRSETDADGWANTIRNVVIQARRRATATKNPYLVELGAARAQWCQVDSGACRTDTPVSCGAPAAGAEVGRVVVAGADAMTAAVAYSADVSTVGGTYAPPQPQALVGTAQLFFGPNGTVDRSCKRVLGPVTGLSGYTIYVRASNVVSQSTAVAEKRRRIVLFGVTGRPRIIDNY